MTETLTISNYNKFPEVEIEKGNCIQGWDKIRAALQLLNERKGETKKVVAIECYHGVYVSEIFEALGNAAMMKTEAAYKDEDEIIEMVQPFVTDDPVFGSITTLQLEDYFSAARISLIRTIIGEADYKTIYLIGAGATIIYPDADIIIYADMPRWEIQLRFRQNRISNLGRKNFSDSFAYQYKHAYFVDWRVCDNYKKKLANQWHYLLDTTIEQQPKMIAAEAMAEALKQLLAQPFRVVPFFDPGPWGGQWLKEVCDLDRSEQNYAWGFDCVPEENSLLLNFKGTRMEIPSVNLVFFYPKQLLGEKVYKMFGDEFPIRFDFLDTMQGGNLSLQVHPLKEYIKEQFGMSYTQDESYYILDAGEDASVYLGLKENIQPEKMLDELEKAQTEDAAFDAEKYVAKWHAKKHDHFSIPAGTVHCSGANSVVLEISATPYIFTFKLWDWGRMGLDGNPRPISLEHGKNVIQWNRTETWIQQNILNKLELVAEGDGWREERTGLDDASFIETRRHWFTKKVLHHTNGSVNVLNLVQGREAIVESPENLFKPFVVHYAETFIVPAAVGSYTIQPYGESEGKECATVKAYVRTERLNGTM